MMNYTTLYGLFALTSLMLSNALILMARYIRQVQSPPTDSDFENLLKEKETIEVQLAQEQRSIAGLKGNIEQLEADLKKVEESLKAKTEELDGLRAAAART